MKRGQVTIFIIIAIVWLLAFMFLHYLNTLPPAPKAPNDYECPQIGQQYHNKYCGKGRVLVPLLQQGDICQNPNQCVSKECVMDYSSKSEHCVVRNQEGDFVPGHCGRCA